jgi:hypothetical protein
LVFPVFSYTVLDKLQLLICIARLLTNPPSGRGPASLVSQVIGGR